MPLTGVKIISSKNCPACIELKKILESQIKEKKITVVDIEDADEQTTKIIKELNIKTVPAIILEGDEGYCLVDKDFNITKCIKKETS